MGEFDLLRRLAPLLSSADQEGDIAVGYGDDAAVLVLAGRGVVVTVDVVVAGVHFDPALSSMADVGWKAVAVNVSDIAAMGARPTAAVVGLSTPADLPAEAVDQLYVGMTEACTRWGLRLVGGDTVTAPALALSVTALGQVDPPRAVRRGGARPGDAIVVVGALGAASAALAQHAKGLQPTPALLAAHRRPVALVEAGLALAAAGATAMIDVSDGLGADLGHVCAASGVRARVREADLPVAPGVAEAAAAAGMDPRALVTAGGEDFALLATLPPAAAAEAVRAAAAAEGVPGAVVGTIQAPYDGGDGPVVTLACADGSEADLTGAGYEHATGTAAS